MPTRSALIGSTIRRAAALRRRSGCPCAARRRRRAGLAAHLDGVLVLVLDAQAHQVGFARRPAASVRTRSERPAESSPAGVHLEHERYRFALAAEAPRPPRKRGIDLRKGHERERSLVQPRMRNRASPARRLARPHRVRMSKSMTRGPQRSPGDAPELALERFELAQQLARGRAACRAAPPRCKSPVGRSRPTACCDTAASARRQSPSARERAQSPRAHCAADHPDSSRCRSRRASRYGAAITRILATQPDAGRRAVEQLRLCNLDFRARDARDRRRSRRSISAAKRSSSANDVDCTIAADALVQPRIVERVAQIVAESRPPQSRSRR